MLFLFNRCVLSTYYVLGSGDTMRYTEPSPALMGSQEGDTDKSSGQLGTDSQWEVRSDM